MKDFRSKMFQSSSVMMTLKLKNAFQIDLKLFPTFKKCIHLTALLINMFPVATSWGLWNAHTNKTAQQFFLKCYYNSNRLTNLKKIIAVLFLAVHFKIFSLSDLVNFKKGFKQTGNFTSCFAISLSNMPALKKVAIRRMNFTLVLSPWVACRNVFYSVTLPVTVAGINHLNFVYTVHNQHFWYIIILQMAFKTGGFQFIPWTVNDDNKTDHKRV